MSSRTCDAKQHLVKQLTKGGMDEATHLQRWNRSHVLRHSCAPLKQLRHSCEARARARINKRGMRAAL